MIHSVPPDVYRMHMLPLLDTLDLASLLRVSVYWKQVLAPHPYLQRVRERCNDRTEVGRIIGAIQLDDTPLTFHYIRQCNQNTLSWTNILRACIKHKRHALRAKLHETYKKMYYNSAVVIRYDMKHGNIKAIPNNQISHRYQFVMYSARAGDLDTLKGYAHLSNLMWNMIGYGAIVGGHQHILEWINLSGARISQPMILMAACSIGSYELFKKHITADFKDWHILLKHITRIGDAHEEFFDEVLKHVCPYLLFKPIYIAARYNQRRTLGKLLEVAPNFIYRAFNGAARGGHLSIVQEYAHLIPTLTQNHQLYDISSCHHLGIKKLFDERLYKRRRKSVTENG